MFTLLLHIYYHDSWRKIFKDQLLALKDYSPSLMINLCMDIPGSIEVIHAIKKDFPSAFIITTPNKGKDIGGKLALIHFFLSIGLQAEFIVFLHDKVSPYSISGERWRAKLFTIIEPQKISSILEKFQKDSSIGIIGASEFVATELDITSQRLDTTNKKKLEQLVSLYHLNITNHTFVAGTMFWIRSSVIRQFFSKFPPLECRELLEEGNPTDQYEGTYTHSWERLFCWIANDQQYIIKGI